MLHHGETIKQNLCHHLPEQYWTRDIPPRIHLALSAAAAWICALENYQSPTSPVLGTRTLHELLAYRLRLCDLRRTLAIEKRNRLLP